MSMVNLSHVLELNFLDDKRHLKSIMQYSYVFKFVFFP